MNKVIAVLFLLFIAFGTLWGQSNRATITGTVTDSSGALVVGAEISATNIDTGVLTKAASNQAGIYSVLNLPAGTYRVAVKKTGFKPLEYPSVTLIVDQVARMNMSLTVGSVNETVTVTENAPVLDAETATVGTNMKGNVVSDLPLNIYGGRTAEAFAVAITPGYSPLSDPYMAVINGTQGFTKEFTVDGTSATAQIQGDSMEIGPTMEAVEEMQAETIGLGASNASTNGGVMMFNLKSGTNRFHGTAFGFGHNELLDANQWDNGHLMQTCTAANGVGSPECGKYNKQKARFWDYGFSAGGPIIRNKTFFFGAFERYTQNDFTLGQLSATLPTPAFLGGDFSSLLDTSTVLGTDPHGNPIYQGAIFNPADPGAVFVGNIIPTTMLSDVSKKIVDLYKQHYAPEASTTHFNNRLPASNSPLQTPIQIVVKLDHNLNENDRVNGSWIYNHRPRTLVDSGGVWSPGTTDGGPFANARLQKVISNQYRISESHTFSPTMLNVFNVTYNEYLNGSVPANGTDWPQTLGFGNAGATNFPQISFGGSVNGVGVTSIGNKWQGNYVGDTFILGDNLSWSRGRHSFTLGGDFRAMQINSHGSSGALSFNFSPAATGAPTAEYASQVGFGFASFLLGNVDSASETTAFNLYGRRKAMSLFVEDNYKVTPKLTMNLGLRWDATFRFHEKNGNWANFNMTKIDPELGIPGMMEYAKNGSDSFETNQNWHNFGPHIGVAYNPTSKLVIRGSYGILYVPIGTQYWTGVPYAFAPQAHGSNNAAGPFNWDAGYPGVVTPPKKLSTLEASYLLPVVSVDPNSLSTGYTHNFTFGVQYELTRNTKVEASYIGNRGRRLQDSGLYNNQPDPKTWFNLVNSGHMTDWVWDEASATAAGVKYPYAGFSNYAFTAVAPFPQLASGLWTMWWWYPNLFTVGTNVGQSRYDSMVLQVVKRTGSGLTMDFSYTYSKSLTDTNNAFGESWDVGGIQDYTNLSEAANTLSPYDQKHVFKGYATYQLPFGRGHSILGDKKGFVNALVGGWQVSALLLYASGKPLSFSSSNWYWWPAWSATYVNYDLQGYSGSKFSSGAYTPPTTDNPVPNGNMYFPGTVASNPASGQMGKGPARIDALRTFGSIREDASIMKYFNIGTEGRYKLSIRAEFYNIFNRHTFKDPITKLGDPAFGYVLGVNSAPRTGQFGARFEW